MTDVAVVRRIAESLERLAAVSRAQFERASVEFEQLVTEYVSVRKGLARDFQELAKSELASQEPALEGVKRRITQRMRELLGGRVPDEYLQVRGYRGVHLILFDYLLRHVGEPVSASRLRVLTGDQVHTERRLRELRDLGFHLTSERVADEDQYVLHSPEPDLAFAARFIAEHNIREDSKLSDVERAALLSSVGLVGDRA